ncbi:MAG TPA: ATP-binding protein [Bacteroidales bacterium]|nr:ATP-binding protein [Bacteroidales bacterium]HSA42425.1 ATP-binding protein [Bacteroidales bacterium]
MLSQQEWLIPGQHEIPRNILKDIGELSPFGYIITGVRRAGKSTLLRQIMQERNARNYFNFEDSRTAGFEVRDFRTLEDLYLELFGSNHELYFDEIQTISGWEKYVRDALDRRKTIVITGSNAQMLSRELGNKLTGRHLDFEIFPFSYNEFIQFREYNPGPESLLSYLSHGGFPAFLSMGREELLSTLVRDILERDILMRYKLRNHGVYRQIVQYLLSNTGKEISFNKLKNVFEIGSASTVMEFIQYLTDAYLVFLLPKYDTSLKVQARNPRKVYGIDTGLVNFSSISGSPDRGHLLENSIFLHLRRQGHQIWYFRGKKECDFITRDRDHRHAAMQVCWQLGTDNEEREISGLRESMAALKLTTGRIITFDQEDMIKSADTVIEIVPAWKIML